MVAEKIHIISKVEIEMFILQFRSDGILHIHGTGQEIGILSYKNLVNKIGEMTVGKKIPILSTADELAILDEEVRKYMVNKDSNPYSSASAIVAHSISQKLLGNFFMNVMKPMRRIRIFTNEDLAINWLRKFL